MKILNILIITIAFVLPLAAQGGAENESGAVSGTVEAGLRILDVDDSAGELEYTIYRGDYIVFKFEKSGSYQFTVPALEIDTEMPRPASERSYVKMKESGEYEFSLGERSGVFHVLELEDANYHELTAKEAAELIGNVTPVIIDVRTEGEYAGGHIPGAELLPVQIFADNIRELEKYRDDDVLLYCASGNRSTVASRMLIDAGFTRVYNLRRGIGDWVRNGLPIE